MTRNRIIILLALLVTVVGLAGSRMLLRTEAPFLPPPIDLQRVDMQLEGGADIAETLPPDVAVMYTALGSFRGLVVNFMWSRANRLKEEGKHYEAIQLARTITRLQPRFASVWVFQSWNMAYNLSVTARTERERWMWVREGIELLRDEGIPANPNNVTLYKELAWFFIHKIGGFTDDMHWYYKRQLAFEWERLLGRPPVEDVDAYLAWFETIAEMDERYFAVDQISSETRRALAELIGDWPDHSADLRLLRELSPPLVDRRLATMIEANRGEEAQLVEALQQLRELNRSSLEMTADSPVQRLIEAHPEARVRIQALRELGFQLDARLLSRIGYVQALMRAQGLGYETPTPPELQQVIQGLQPWLASEEPDVVRLREQVILPFLRAKVLRDEYNMNPSFMWELIQGRWLRVPPDNRYLPDAEGGYPLPLDWRHPASHALYWAAMGVRKSLVVRMNRDDAYTDVLNTDRTVLHALQAMAESGRIVHDPEMEYYAVLPMPYFNEAYERAFINAYSRIAVTISPELAPDAPKSFQAGHENRMISMITLHYFYGSMEDAQQMYQRLARLYGTKQANRTVRYSQPLKQFVTESLEEDISSPDDARQAVAGLVFQAINQGLANRRPDVSRRFLSQAEFVYRNFQAEHDYDVQNVERHRMRLLPFEKIQADVMAEFLISPQVSPIGKVRVWNTLVDTDDEGLLNLARRIYDRVRPTLARQVGNPEAVDRVFPPPPGMAAWREANPAALEGDDTQDVAPPIDQLD